MQQKIYLVRHGETVWSKEEKHTSFTDLSLTDHGKEQSKWLKEKLSKKSFAKVFCSPLKRAKETCESVGLLNQAEIYSDLVEWNYGEYEGKTTAEIRKMSPEWNIFQDGAPNGETVEDIQSRTEGVLKKIGSVPGNVLLFSSAHFLRALTARFLGYPIEEGKSFLLSTASLSLLGYERETPVIVTWNQTQS